VHTSSSYRFVRPACWEMWGSSDFRNDTFTLPAKVDLSALKENILPSDEQAWFLLPCTEML